MYHLFKDDLWGNKVPYMTVSDEQTASRIISNSSIRITKVLEVPRSKGTIIMM